jgi:DNA-binding protein HU-beta
LEITLNKTDLIEALALKTGHTKVASAEVVDALFDIIGDALAQGEAVQLIGFGAFGITETKARTGRNPQTGNTIQIAAGKRPKFTAGAKLKAAVSKGK